MATDTLRAETANRSAEALAVAAVFGLVDALVVGPELFVA